MRFAIYPYKPESNSAKVLSEAIGCKRIKHQSSKFNKWNNPKWWTINWGGSSCPSGSRVLNSSLNVSVASNKLSYFNLIKDYARVPEYSTDIEVARGWFNQSKLVIIRQTLSGHSGAGVVVVDSPESLTSAPLYCRYVPKDAEYRLHFAFNKEQPFFIQKKKRRTTDFDGEHDNRIRNLKGGWIYAFNDLDVPSDVLLQGARAFGHSNLDFGAIDIIYRKSADRAYVLECNTAPGLEGTTLEKYAEQFRGLIE